ncbi:TetR/AcrR family transcriptional regulator [Modestobacter sp. I12A-02662]|uniref:TetR/AcrR family transcriptional regulator n=1 Tax=Modestobacter sp. I12A-02662 TaxID=1730496 RepID=UPI0034DF6929
MAQVLKDAVRSRIRDAALRCFADQGYAGTSMAGIAAAAGTAPANVYRYFASKEALFAAVVPAELAVRHDELLDARIAALADGGRDGSPAAELLDFWLAHRLAVSVLLDRAEGTPVAGYPAAFVRRLVDHVERALPARPDPAHHDLLHLVFDNTRRAIARILATATDDDHARVLITGFWSYQVPGLDGLIAHLGRSGHPGG